MLLLYIILDEKKKQSNTLIYNNISKQKLFIENLILHNAHTHNETNNK